MPTTLRIALLAGLLALLSSLAVIGFIYVRTHDEAVASLHRQVAEQSKVLTDVYRSGGKPALDQAIADTLTYADPQTSEPANRDTMAVRVLHFIFSMMCLIWALTVGSVIPRAFPISLLVKPWVSAWITSRSRGVRPNRS